MNVYAYVAVIFPVVHQVFVLGEGVRMALRGHLGLLRMGSRVARIVGDAQSRDKLWKSFSVRWRRRFLKAVIKGKALSPTLNCLN